MDWASVITAMTSQSLSARRAWIEIKYVVKDSDFAGVALRKESVDRNEHAEPTEQAESLVALRKESVDRNVKIMIVSSGSMPSLSARRAWIEIPPVDTSSANVSVALRKESVDRNGPVGTYPPDRPGRSPQGERG